MTNNQQHPITPPPELVRQWFADWESSDNEEVSFAEFAVPRAAQWGADQELEAITELAGGSALPEEDRYLDGITVASLRAARRPKPMSLKKLALLQLDVLNADLFERGLGRDLSQIRRALEQIDD